MKTKIIFFGSSKHVLPVIQVLKKNFDLTLVITTEKNQTDIIPSFCIKNKIPYISVFNLSDSKVNGKLSIVNCELAVLADFGLILPNKILSLFSKGIINIHPSLLPKYRGPSPVQTAILNGNKKTGISIIKLDEKVDHGPIIFQKEENVKSQDTFENLCQRLFKIGADNLYQTIQQYIKGELKPTLQDDSKATFTKKLTKADGYIDLPSLKIENLKLEIAQKIRAYYPWPGVFFKTKLSGQEKIIKLLPGEKIQVEGKKPMSYKDFANGYSEGEEILEKLNLI